MRSILASHVGWVALIAAAAGCAMPPKPRELAALEKLRSHQHAESAVDRSPRFGKEADRLLRRARESWEANDLHECRRDARLATIRLRTALVIFERDRQQSRLAELERELADAEAEYQRLRGALVAVEEQVVLMEQIRDERASAAEQRQRAAAHVAIAEAELALRTADTVNASAHASEEHSSAVGQLSLAREALRKEDFDAATAAATSSRELADAALERAQPVFSRNEEAQEKRARDVALARDAAALPRVTVRLEGDGDVTRLVVPIHGLFTRNGRTLRPSADRILDLVADLLRKYSSYPVQILGHTDDRGRRRKLVSVSRARAEATRDALVRRGVREDRFAVSGVGPDRPLADNRTRSGRARNNRVEIVFLYR